LACFRLAGTAKSDSGMDVFTSIFSIVVVAEFAGSFFGPDVIEKGYITPFTGL
jgi:hypothetical protein